MNQNLADGMKFKATADQFLPTRGIEGIIRNLSSEELFGTDVNLLS